MSAGVRPVLLLTFVILLLLLRQIGASLELYHFQPYIALFFALAALKKAHWLIVPAVAYLISTIVTEGGMQSWMLSPLLAFALIIAWGKCFSQKATAPALLGGSLGGAGIFYLVTNTMSWLTDGQYAKSFAGLGQALWTGLPGYAPTWTFFRNDALSTVLFTAIILVINGMKFSQKSTSTAAIEAQTSHR